MLIKKIFSVLLLVFTVVVCISVSASAIEISAESAVVIDTCGNEILFEKDAFQKRSMASTTKIMTTILAVESGKLGCDINVTEKMTNAEGTSIGLRCGYRITLGDLVYGMMLESGNDAANAVAIYLSGSLEAFSELMNEKAKEIGMNHTHFVTPSGLDDEEHYSTAYDMALLASYCIKNPCFKQICSTKRYTANLKSPDNYRLYFSNHNRLLSSVEGVFGVKTGFTKKSGRCLVSAIEKSGATLVAVTLSAPDDWNDHKKLYSLCFESLSSKTVTFDCPKKIRVIGGKVSFVKLRPECASAEVSKNGNEEIFIKVYLPKFVYAPIKEDEVIGKIVLTNKAKAIKTISVLACESVETIEETYVKPKGFFEKIKEKIKSSFL